MNTQILQFPNIGVIGGFFTEEQLNPIKNEITEIENNFDASQSKKFNKELAGNIRKEFFLTKSKKHINELFQPVIHEFNETFEYFRELTFSKEVGSLTLDTVWVNFQKKYEFNPIHNHSGFLSFVIWIKIPYSMSDERLNSPGSESNNPVAGNFTFHYTNILGKICQQEISADKTKENHFFIFPSELSHSVHPFFTSDEYRISISGNFKFKSNESKEDE